MIYINDRLSIFTKTVIEAAIRKTKSAVPKSGCLTIIINGIMTSIAGLKRLRSVNPRVYACFE
jgi:hypothetical protein